MDALTGFALSLAGGGVVAIGVLVWRLIVLQEELDAYRLQCESQEREFERLRERAAARRESPIATTHPAGLRWRAPRG
jgi:hypothetical protein